VARSSSTLAARMLGGLMQRLWLSQGDWPGRWAGRRLRRWQAAAETCAAAVQAGTERATVDL
jgi:hypothetical protein